MDPIRLARLINLNLPLREQNDGIYLNEIEIAVRPTATYKHISETFVAGFINKQKKKRAKP